MKLTRLFFIRFNSILGNFSLSFFLLLCSSCSTLSSESFSPPSPTDDAKYEPVLKKWRKNISVYKDLELRLRASAVLISPEMEESYKVRLSEIHGNQAKVDNKIVLSKDTISVVIEIFTKTEAFLDLNDESLWNLSLTMQGNTSNPISVYRYRKKELLLPYFPISTQWSRFYVVVFKLPLELQNENAIKDFFQKKEPQIDLPPSQDRIIVFSMNSGEAQVKFSWGL